MDYQGITWDYEESTTCYYHIYPVGGPLDGVLSIITIDIPQTPENDADVQAIIDALRRIAIRNQGEVEK